MQRAGVAMAVCFAMQLGGCAPKAEIRADQRPVVAEPARNEAGGGMDSVSSDKLEEIDMFFHRKAAQLQYACYNTEADKNHQKYQGNVSIALVVLPGGKASDVKLIGSSIKSEGIENCVVDAIKGWEWPDVNAPAPYTGSINFKPAW